MIPIIMPVIQVTVPSPATTQATPGPTAVMIPLIIAGARRQAGPPLQVAAAIFLAVALMVYQAGILPWLDRRIEWILHCGTTGAGAAEASCDDRPMTTLVTEFSPAAPSRSDGPGRWCNQVSRHSALRLLLILLSFRNKMSAKSEGFFDIEWFFIFFHQTLLQVFNFLAISEPHYF